MIQALSYAKVNLALQLVEERVDGYHNIRTIFKKISLADEICIESFNTNKIELKVEGLDIPDGKENLAWKAAELLKKETGLKKGVKIELYKNIPVSAGLGGGSSNAATVLTALNKLWSINMTDYDLMELSKKLGSDVPFFLSGYDASFATEKGDNLFSLFIETGNHFILLVNPGFPVSSQFAYEKFSFVNRSKFFPEDIKNDSEKFLFYLEETYLKHEYAHPTIDISEVPAFNDFESVLFPLYPELAKLKEELYKQGAKKAMLSGSGPTIFGIFDSKKEAESCLAYLKNHTHLTLHIAAFTNNSG